MYAFVALIIIFIFKLIYKKVYIKYIVNLAKMIWSYYSYLYDILRSNDVKFRDNWMSYSDKTGTRYTDRNCNQ